MIAYKDKEKYSPKIEILENHFTLITPEPLDFRKRNFALS